MSNLKVAILGSGNIGTDLMKKIMRSSNLELVAVIGIDPESDGLRKAREAGFQTFHTGLDGFLDAGVKVDAVFDATSAYTHIKHAEQLRAHNIRAIDLTPAAIGPLIVPTVNLHAHPNADNVNMVTCGGQATIPIIHAVSKLYNVEYAEIVATIASKSAGPATRANIDEFIATTSRAIELVGGAKKGRTVLILNPAEPPIMMNDTIHLLVDRPVEEDTLYEALVQAEQAVQQYVPGYRLKSRPFVEGNRISVFLEVAGAADYLPAFAGNLDIITAASIKIAEEWAKSKALL
ncbi:Acetaldehyde dehydrogenase [Solibacillus isronensis B3W22]|uniref:Acetaldehyde dehydrogenase n=1 Tax=Solibacillus isronensis B3W22 TaxID=1224748 RepID=K1KUG5_9BACL|nr:acetaldehyde dehydrogenase (acetylating) [Solibacillus isronensis]AMO87460.1 acetaldehyde dehydrogenase (acetylating) [Solibacillus silvestris]EKB43552.1 Acetaldehyde dehydrogenase [Solibacillus isronensis B3W22]